MTNKENSNSDASRPRQGVSCCSPRKKGVHYQLSFTTAQQLGFDLQESRTIAKSNEEVDKCYKPEQNLQNYWRHFDPLAWLLFRRDSRDFFAGYYLKLAVQSGDVSYLGTGLHSLQDKFAHGLIPFQKDLPILRIFTGTWRDNPKLNPKAFKKTKSATSAYLAKFLEMRNKKQARS
jgi:hypothetical protein